MTTHELTSMPAAPPVPQTRTGVPPVRVGAVSLAAALVGNAVVYGAASAAGASFLLQQAGSEIAVTLVGVVIATAVPLLLATAALALVRRSPGLVTALAWAGLVIGVLTVAAPVLAQADPVTRAALVTMHVLTGVAWFTSVRRVR